MNNNPEILSQGEADDIEVAMFTLAGRDGTNNLYYVCDDLQPLFNSHRALLAERDRGGWIPGERKNAPPPATEDKFGLVEASLIFKGDKNSTPKLVTYSEILEAALLKFIEAGYDGLLLMAARAHAGMVLNPPPPATEPDTTPALPPAGRLDA